MKRNLIYHTHITANKAVQAWSQTGMEFDCHIDAIGRDGMMLTCDRQTLDALLPNSMHIAPKRPATIETRFQLDTLNDITTRCEVIYARRMSRDQFLLEVRFDHLDDQQFEEVDLFVASAIEKGHRPIDNNLKQVA